MPTQIRIDPVNWFCKSMEIVSFQSTHGDLVSDHKSLVHIKKLHSIESVYCSSAHKVRKGDYWIHHHLSICPLTLPGGRLGIGIGLESTLAGIVHHWWGTLELSVHWFGFEIACLFLFFLFCAFKLFHFSLQRTLSLLFLLNLLMVILFFLLFYFIMVI